MKPNAVVKLAIVANSILLLAAFVSYRAGAFSGLSAGAIPGLESGFGVFAGFRGHSDY